MTIDENLPTTLYRPEDSAPRAAEDPGRDQAAISGSDVAHIPVQPGRDISHALRTQLAIITLLSGNLDLLYERLDDEKRRSIIKDLRKHTHELNDLARDLLLQLS